MANTAQAYGEMEEKILKVVKLMQQEIKPNVAKYARDFYVPE